MPRRYYSTYTPTPRAIRRGHAKDDDAHYERIARERREAEEKAATAQAQPTTEGEKKNG